MPTIEIVRRIEALGMPQTVIGGLSETWLFEQCGDIHWELLARLFGYVSTDLFDSDGDRLYTGIVACELSSTHGLHLLREGMDLSLTGRLRSLRGTASWAEIEVASQKLGVVAVVELLARFVRRKNPAQNTEIGAGSPRHGSSHAFGDIDNAAIYRRHRRELALRRRPRAPEPGARVHERCFCPCPTLDFNGADLLYFAKYQTFVERTEWDVRHALGIASLPVLARSTFYFGNLDPGDAICVKLEEPLFAGATMNHVARLYRASDAVLIATVRTTKLARVPFGS